MATVSPARFYSPLISPLVASDDRRWRFLEILFAASILLRVLSMYRLPLIPEEAYYWMYSQHPDLSYFDHPPMVAWVIGLGTKLFGNTEFGVRAVNTSLMVIASLAMYAYGKVWFPRPAALLGAIALHVLPLYFFVGFITTMDAALVMFWTLGMLGASYALRYGRVWGWYLAGFSVGGAILSKYTGVFLAFGIFVAMLGHHPWRRKLLSVHPWLGVALAGAMFAPVLIWNANNGWASFRFQFVDRYAEASFDPRHFLSFTGFQFLAVTPVPLIAIAMILFRLAKQSRWRRARWYLTLCFFLPLLLVTAYKAVRYDIHMNWTLPAYVALFPAIATWLMARARLIRKSSDLNDAMRPWVWTAAICMIVNSGLLVFLLTLQPKLGGFPQFGPWRELASIVEQKEDELAAQTGYVPLVICDGKYRLASVMAFYRKPIEDRTDTAAYTTSRWILNGEGLGFEYWIKPQRWYNTDCIYVTDSADENVQKQLQGHFESVTTIDDPRLRHLGTNGYAIAICRGLRERTEKPDRKSHTRGAVISTSTETGY